MFSIELLETPEGTDQANEPTEAPGRIVIGDFTESFRVPLGFWRESDYRRSWQQAFEHLEVDRHAVSCLMTSMTDPASSNFLSCWPMYRDGEVVYIQNAIIFLEEIGQDFDPEEPWNHIGPRQSIDEDGNKISEWMTSINSLEQFFEV